jgi:hypothetical protein
LWIVGDTAISDAPPEQCIQGERVLNIHQHRYRRIDARELLDGDDRVKECATGAAKALRDLDPHHSQCEQQIDEGPRDRTAVVL